jgi:membrane-bound metal-dependent hydrolase YbcI (DUF457 family)
MSGIGHFAPGLAAKTAAPQIPLWVFLVAGETNDLLYFLFTSLGLEQKAETTMSFTEGVKFLSPVSNPWSHGFFMSVLWSVIAAALAYLFYRDRRSSLILGAVVFSHWALDFLMHSNLPLFFDGSPMVGIGLENSGPGLLIMTLFDLALLAAGIVIYFRAKKLHQRKNTNV